ncbi:hypothetical protein [Vibrio breoganii]|nr:hypothetical protein [Vibrio breoganii]
MEYQKQAKQIIDAIKKGDDKGQKVEALVIELLANELRGADNG